LSNKSWIESY